VYRHKAVRPRVLNNGTETGKRTAGTQTANIEA